MHAAAIVKAKAKGDTWLADRVYSGIPPATVGRKQLIEVRPMSGLSDVRYWLREHGYDPNDEVLCKRIFNAAKQSDHTPTEGEVRAVCRAV